MWINNLILNVIYVYEMSPGWLCPDDPMKMQMHYNWVQTCDIRVKWQSKKQFCFKSFFLMYVADTERLSSKPMFLRLQIK